MLDEKVIFEPKDIVSIIPFLKTERVTGYVTDDLKVRCPHPIYETHLFNSSMKLILKKGFK